MRSSKVNGRFCITTAIDYPNGHPHMGHAYEKIITDCYARWHRFLGDEVFFLTGTDENGQKLQEAARAEGLETKEFVDQNVEVFKKLCTDLKLSYDDFIRTTQERHQKICREFWIKLEGKGDLSFGQYSGHYCLSCENFYTDLQAPDGKCPYHGTALSFRQEDGFFFQMSKYHEWIVDYLEKNPNFIVPQKRYNEIMSRLKDGPLKDVAFSRPHKGWGIPVPKHEKKFVMYTWADALVNYYSALKSKDLEEKFWPADVHVIGKDIVWFHCVIWPCMLKAVGLPLPKQVYVHGMILAEDGRKMSKSLNNVIDPSLILKKYPLDTFRYYLLRSIPAQGDGAFLEKELVDKHNNELGNDYGNLLMRVVKLALKNLPPELKGQGVRQELDFQKHLREMQVFMEKREHNRAMDKLWEGIREANQYVNDKEPWKFKDQPEALTSIIYNGVFGIHQLALLMEAFVPDSSKKTLSYLNPSTTTWAQLKFGQTSYQLKTPEALFPKLEL